MIFSAGFRRKPLLPAGLRNRCGGGARWYCPSAPKLKRILPICPKRTRQLFLDELGLEASGLDRLIQKGYALLGLISYLTAGKPEVRAWTITKGTKAPQAAGKIHSDFERGFIRAEVVAFDDLDSLR